MRVDKTSYSSCRAASDARPCVLHIKGYRHRSSGPGHRLAVLKCVIHILYFTVYPHGWVPFARKRLSEEGLLRAATDAASGVLWKDQEELTQNETRTTQTRRIKLCAKLFGLDLDENRHAEIAYKLGINASDLIEVNRKIRDGPMRRKTWGTWIANIFNKIPSKPDPVSKLMWCAKNAGLWTDHLMWSSATLV